jgi:hypothetical protein
VVVVLSLLSYIPIYHREPLNHLPISCLPSVFCPSAGGHVVCCTTARRPGPLSDSERAMDFFFAPMPDAWLLPIGVGLVVSSVTVLALSKRQRETILERFHIQRRRASGASTPPRSLSPDNKCAAPTDVKEPLSSFGSPPDYLNTLPPSRRSALAELAETTSPSVQKILVGTEPPGDLSPENILPTTQSYELENDTREYTPTGFSTAEIKALGDFPAYDILSGVPLPQPYHNFDPENARPRPYRPFRWAYHQTMCRFPPNLHFRESF